MNRASKASSRLLVLLVPLLGSMIVIALLPAIHGTLKARTPIPPHLASPRIFPRADYVALAQQRHAIGGDFATYYVAHHGSDWLGQAVTAEIPIDSGQEQIFEGGILRMDAHGDIAPLPIVATLVGAGAQIPLATPDSTLTYATLAPALRDPALAPAPWWWSATTAPALAGIFLARRERQHQSVGYYVPAAFAAFLTQLGDWQTLAGEPLTQAQAGVIWQNGVTHHITVQAFAHIVLLLDRDMPGPIHVMVQPTGADYLAIYGPPVSHGTQGRDAWTIGDHTAILPGPDAGATGSPIATFYTPVPVALASDPLWFGGVLWYHITWQNLATWRDGWVTADQVSFSAPTGATGMTGPSGAGAQIVDLGALSPQLGTFAHNQGGGAAVAVYVPDLNRYYVYNPNAQMIAASTFKIPILLTLLSQAESQRRGLTGDEQADAQSMIEYSGNDAAAALYADVGYDAGIERFMASVGLTITINTNGFGYSTMTAMTMTRLLDDLRAGRILDAVDRQYALNLMSNVSPAQQMGVGATAPAGATVALKDGWGIGDGGWITDSVGIVTGGGHTYIISVFADGRATSDDGWSVVDTICRDAAANLLGR